MGSDTPGLTVDSGETNTCLKVRDRGQPLPSPGLLPRKASGSAAWPPAARREARPPGAHVTRMGRTVSSGNSREQQATEPVSGTPRSPAPGHSAAPPCPAEGLPGTELPELEHGHPSPAGRPRSARSAGWERERDKDGQPSGHWTQKQGLLQGPEGRGSALPPDAPSIRDAVMDTRASRGKRAGQHHG